jgi:putative inorganic carbon (HCO3(-)) transporter
MTYNEIQPKQIKRYTQVATLFGLIIILFFSLWKGYATSVVVIAAIVALSYIVSQFSMKTFFIFMVLVIPLSTNQKILDSEIMLLIPSEPVEAIIAMAFVFKILFGYKISAEVLKHPIFWVLLLGLLIQYLAVLNSMIIVVSLKSIFLKSCYFLVFFVLAADLYMKKYLNHFTILKTYTFSLFIVGLFIFFKHLNYGLSKDVSGSVTEPFYADHTIYSACLAFILPYSLLLFLFSKKLQLNFYHKFWMACLSAVLLIFFFYTYCRAGWVSLLIASCIIWAMFKGIKFYTLTLCLLSALSLLFIFRSDIAEMLKQNKSDSNAKNANLEEQTKSVANITSDQSNAERLNRWSCAWRMFIDKPFLGHGPGTYQFEYLSYQKRSEMTQISTTTPYNIKKGKGGTAHSEYLLLLSESGIFSLIFYLVAIMMIFYFALFVFAKSTMADKKIKIMIILFGFCTYILHACFNNFLDTDKAALLYYTSMAAIMIEAIELRNELKPT